MRPVYSIWLPTRWGEGGVVRPTGFLFTTAQLLLDEFVGDAEMTNCRVLRSKDDESGGGEKDWFQAAL